MRKKAKKEFDDAIRASVIKEMAKPRIATSAREGKINLAAARIVRGKPRKKKLQSLVLAVPQSAW
jgi:hypothetical protein